MDSRSVVITGSSSGIGRAAAVRLARSGWRVFAGVRKEADAESLKAENSSITPITVDVTDESTVAAAGKVVLDETGGRLDGLVNNAGIVVHGPLEGVSVEEWQRQFDTNVLGLIRVTQAFLPALRAATGRVVNIGSVAGRSPSLPFMGPYAASKWAIEALSDSLRAELRAQGIRVIVVEPGSIDTPIWTKADPEFDRFSDEVVSLYGSMLDRARAITSWSGRNGVSPEKVAKVIESALSSSRPRLRYLVGFDAVARAHVEKRLPHRLRDRIVARVVGNK